MYKKLILLTFLLSGAFNAADQSNKKLPRLYTEKDYNLYRNKRVYFSQLDIQKADIAKVVALNHAFGKRVSMYVAVCYEQMEERYQQRLKKKSEIKEAVKKE